MSDDSLFGSLGRDGILPDLRRILRREDGVETIANLIINTVDGGLGDKDNIDKSGTRPAPDWVRGLAQVLMEWFADQGLPPTPLALKANAYALSLVSPDTRKLLVPKGLRQQLGLPTGVDLPDFFLVAGREGFALAFAIAPTGADLPELFRRVQSGEWVMSTRSLSNEAKASEVARATVSSYRERPEYRQMVRDFCGWTLLAWAGKGKLARIPHMTVADIRKRVQRLPASFVVRAFGANATEYIPPHAPPEGIRTRNPSSDDHAP